MNEAKRYPEKVYGFRNIGLTIEKLPDLWILLVSATATLLSAFFVYRFSGTELTHFKDRTIGICAACGIDPDLRSAIFIKAVLLAIFTFCTVFILLSILNRYLEKQGISFRVSVEKTALSIFSGVGIVNFILYIITLNTAFKNSFLLMLFLMVFVPCLTAGRVLIEKRRGGRIRGFSHSILAAGLIIPYQTILGYAAFFEKKLIFGPKFFVIYMSAWVCLNLFLKILCSASDNLSKTGQAGVRRSIICAGIPLISIPAVIPLSNELQYILVKYFFIPPQRLAFAGILISLVVAAALFIYFLRKNTFYFKESKLISNIYFPIIIAVDVLFIAHNQFIDIERIDLFHMGEGVLPVQQMVQFNQIPYIDYQPLHGLFDMVPQIFFYLFNKNATLDMLVWGNGYMIGWFSNIVAYILLFALLKKLTSPLFSLFVIICIPLRQVIEPYFNPIIIPALILLYTIKSPNFYRLILFWLSVLFLVLWRVDFGIAVICASFMVLAGLSLTKSEFSYRSVISSFFTVFVSVVAFFSIIVFLKGKPLLELVSQLYAYIAIQVPSQSYPEIIKQYDYLAILQYVFLPAISVSYIIFYFLRVFISRKSLDSLRHILAFLAVISLVISMRSLHRHSLHEGVFATYLYIFLMAFLPFYFYRINKRKTMSLFLFVALVSYIAVPPFFPRFFLALSMKEGYPVFSVDEKVFSYNTWQKGDRRIVMSDPMYNKILNVTAFFDRHLEKDQTFFDLSNSPLLYSFAKRRHPAFVSESAYQTSEIMQKTLVKHLKKELKDNKLPLIVFKQNSCWDFYDFFPNEMRSYRVAEFIYNNYVPLLTIENYEIWAANTFDTINLKKAANKENTSVEPDGPNIKIIDYNAYKQEFSLRMLPYVWGTYDETGPAKNLKALFTFQDNIPCKITRERPYTARFDANMDKSKGNYLHLSIYAENPATVKILYGKTSSNTFDFALKPTGRTESYLVRISSQWAWVYQPVSSMKITTSGPVTLQGARILEGD